MVRILLWNSAVRVHDSQAYRKMDVTRERISCILELREILLSFQTAFNLVNAAVVCAILESISGLEPSSVIAEPNTSTSSKHSLGSTHEATVHHGERFKPIKMVILAFLLTWENLGGRFNESFPACTFFSSSF